MCVSCVALLIFVDHFLSFIHSFFLLFCFYDVDAVVVVVVVIIGAVKWWNVGEVNKEQSHGKTNVYIWYTRVFKLWKNRI